MLDYIQSGGIQQSIIENYSSASNGPDFVHVNIPPPQLTLSRKLRRHASSNRWVGTAGTHSLNLLRFYASWISFLKNFISFDKLHEFILSFTDFISPVGRVVSGLKLINNLRYNDDSRLTQIVITLSGITSIIIGILALALLPLAPILSATNGTNNAFYNLWLFGQAFKNRYFGDWKKDYEQLLVDEQQFNCLLENQDNVRCFKHYKLRTNDNALQNETATDLDELEHNLLKAKNLHCERKADLASKLHNACQQLVTLCCIFIALYPPTLFIGSMLLFASGLYSNFYSYDFPFNWASRIRNRLFRPITSDGIEALQNHGLTKAQLAKEKLPLTTNRIASSLQFTNAALTPSTPSGNQTLITSRSRHQHRFLTLQPHRVEPKQASRKTPLESTNHSSEMLLLNN